MKKEYTITLEFGSEFQQQVWEAALGALMAGLAQQMESKHKKNKWTVKETTVNV